MQFQGSDKLGLLSTGNGHTSFCCFCCQSFFKDDSRSQLHQSNARFKWVSKMVERIVQQYLKYVFKLAISQEVTFFANVVKIYICMHSLLRENTQNGQNSRHFLCLKKEMSHLWSNVKNCRRRLQYKLYTIPADEKLNINVQNQLFHNRNSPGSCLLMKNRYNQK